MRSTASGAIDGERCDRRRSSKRRSGRAPARAPCRQHAATRRPRLLHCNLRPHSTCACGHHGHQRKIGTARERVVCGAIAKEARSDVPTCVTDEHVSQVVVVADRAILLTRTPPSGSTCARMGSGGELSGISACYRSARAAWPAEVWLGSCADQRKHAAASVRLRNGVRGSSKAGCGSGPDRAHNAASHV